MIRRDFLKAMFAAAAAPAIVKAASLMKIAPPTGFLLSESGLYTQSGLKIADAFDAETYEAATGINYRELAKSRLADWWSERMDQLVMQTLTNQHVYPKPAPAPVPDWALGMGGRG